jgi:hypothetical protein
MAVAVAPVSIRSVETKPANFGEIPQCVLCVDPHTQKPPKKSSEVLPTDVLCRTHAIAHWPIKDERNPVHMLVK